MPGSSLWLVPPPSHPLHAAIAKLISTTIPSLFPASSPTPPSFSPHLTLTSNIDPAVYGLCPQAWLDGIPFPPARVVFERVMTQDVYYRRCYLKCAFDGLRDVAGLARARGVEGEDSVGGKTEAWLEEWRSAFGPHVSLMYGDVPLDEANVREVEQAVLGAGVALEGASSAGGEGEGEGDAEGDGMRGWEGGTVWLVPTDRAIGEWTPIATRTL